MDNRMQLSVLQGANDPEDRSIIEVSVAKKTRAGLEVIAKTNRKVIAKLFESLLFAASIAQTSKFNDDHCLEDEEEMAEEWKKLTDEIIRLEDIRRKAVQAAALQSDAPDDSATCLRRLVEVHDQMIRNCEEKLDRLLSRDKLRSGSGISSDHYDR